MKTRSSKRLSQTPVIEEESEDNGGDICGKKQRLVKRTAAKMSRSLNVEPMVEKKEEVKNGTNYEPLIERKREVKNGTNYDSDSSGSSSNEFLQPPDTLDLDSDFFKVKKEEPASDFAAIEKAIFSDVKRLSDSENSDCEKPFSFKDNFKVISSVKTETPLVRSSKEDLGNVKLTGIEKKVVKKEITRKGKAKSKNIQEKNDVKQSSGRQTRKKLPNKGDLKKEISDIDKMDVAQLLAHGETQRKESTETSVSHLSESDDDVSDWEEVGGADTLGGKEHSIPEKGVEVTLKVPELFNKRRKKRFDMEAHLKRKLNRRRREIQVLVHKVHLLCWIAHGGYVNSVLNSEVLMGVCLSLIPSQHCYPPDRADLSYLEQIAKWFNKTIYVEKSNSPDKKKESLPLQLSLQKQLATKVANSERDLVLLFICLLRSLGLSARLVISLQPLPLKPPADELCSLSSKKTTQSSKKGKGSPKKSPKKKVGKPDGIPSNNAVPSQKRGVMCREEAVERLKEFRNTGSGEHSSNKSSKTTSRPSTKSKSATTQKESNEANRSLRPRRESSVKYNDSESSDEGSLLVDTSTAHDKGVNIKKGGINDKKHAVQNSTKSNSISKDKTEAKKNSEPGSVSKKPANTGGKDKSMKLRDGHKSNKLPSENIAKNSKHTNSKSVPCDGVVDNGSDDFIPVASCSYQQKKVNSSVMKKKDKVQENGDSDFEPEEQKVRKRTSGPSTKKVDRKVLSSDTDEGEGDKKVSRKQGCDVWTEVYLEAEETWISVDVPRGKVHCVQELYARATKPVTYVLAWNTDRTLKDVTRRYCAQFHTATRKQRVDQDWLDKALKPFLVRRPTARDREEEEDMDRQLQDRPLPKTLAEYKNHPLYVLPRHLLKFEAIYPPDAPPLGFFGKEPVYARECVFTLHSRELWVKEAKVVRPGEKPYKIVKARPKYDRMTGKVLKDLPLEVFGHWQVEDYVPPEAVDGIVPRNPYGNVELFKACMLPKGTVHLQLPGLNRVARKLQIDCAPAMIGFDYHSGGCHPVFDGFVVCEEFKEVLVDAWTKEQAEAIRREQERIDKRVYGNWRRLIKGLMIRERLKARYSFDEPSGSQKKRSKKVKVSSKRRKVESDDDSEWENIE
ncbi:DNA repair protein complementing XP-C cells homolog [Anabrus simplex]|uniref:DNA repair protein complementing XP-C cells homolog n=1 Tax=Anabrus simplex TaxID=316456 RepID=UPI0035A34116